MQHVSANILRHHSRTALTDETTTTTATTNATAGTATRNIQAACSKGRKQSYGPIWARISV